MRWRCIGRRCRKSEKHCRGVLPEKGDAVLFAAGLQATWNAVLKGGAGDRLWTITPKCLAVAGAAAIAFFPWRAAASWRAGISRRHQPAVIVVNNGPPKGLGQSDDRVKPLETSGKPSAPYEKNSYLRMAKLAGIEVISGTSFIAGQGREPQYSS
jgi:hypothetical protein